MFSRWFHSSKKTPSSYKPAVCVLEDRTVPSGFRPSWSGWFNPPAPGPATQLEVEAPRNVKVGQSFFVEVEAKDVNNRLATGYLGTAHFSLALTDTGATVPLNYQFTAGDHGSHWFNFTLTATGTQTITAADTLTPSITGSSATIVNPAPTATHFRVLSPQYVTAGVPVTMTVVALDQYGHVATGYVGTVAFTSTDPNAAVPILANYGFVAGDHGQHTFQVTLPTAGPQTFTATDTTTVSITGQTSVTVEAVGSVTHFGLYSLGFASPGTPTAVLLVALDANNHAVAGYTGTVHFTSSDASLGALADYTFLPGDNGRKIFSVTFNTVGHQTLTATDTVTASITANANVKVSTRGRFPWGFGWF